MQTDSAFLKFGMALLVDPGIVLLDWDIQSFKLANKLWSLEWTNLQATSHLGGVFISAVGSVWGKLPSTY